MGIAALIMGFSVLVSRFMGLFRDKVISWQFGAGGETDLYFAAFILPDFFKLFAGGRLCFHYPYSSSFQTYGERRGRCVEIFQRRSYLGKRHSRCLIGSIVDFRSLSCPFSRSGV